MRQAPAYVIISWVFFILIGTGVAYSWFFYPDAHPLRCIVKAYTGQNCPACGFSRAFSHYLHLEPALGRQVNARSWPVFLFFLLQLLLRLAVLVVYHSRHYRFSQRLINSDIIISISLFLLAFLPVILKN